MRYALILAGGSGTRLWPMSRTGLPKQLIPFLQGRSLLQIAFDRLESQIPVEHRFVCAGQQHREAILAAVDGLDPNQFLGEPIGRDTLNAVGLGAAVLAARDCEAVIGVFTADHLIEPVAEFQRILAQGFALVERHPQTLVTFGITPTSPATGYGYLELGETIEPGARVVRQFREKPPRDLAEHYLQQGPDCYLWNSGMFIWRAATLLDCIRRYEPEIHRNLTAVARDWDTPRRDTTLAEVYPHLRKISVDFAVMEPASRDPAVRVAAVAMPLRWLDVGSWPMFAETCRCDEQGNVLGAQKRVFFETTNCLVASDDPEHLVALLGCRDLIVIHSRNATLVCPAEMAEKIKDLHAMVESQFGPDYA